MKKETDLSSRSKECSEVTYERNARYPFVTISGILKAKVLFPRYSFFLQNIETKCFSLNKTEMHESVSQEKKILATLIILGITSKILHCVATVEKVCFELQVNLINLRQQRKQLLSEVFTLSG